MQQAKIRASREIRLPRESGDAAGILWLYFATYQLVPVAYRILTWCHSLLRGVFSGVWLGVLSRERLHKIGSVYYSSIGKYSDGTYNKSGLWPWETDIIARYFRDRRRLLVLGAGGGREVMALTRSGHEVDAFECNVDLVRVANTLLEEEGLSPCVQFAAPDTFFSGTVSHDGVIVGWGTYMLIQGREQRIALLRQLRGRVGAGSPLLTSFFVRSPGARRFLVTVRIGNLFRWLLQHEPIELGDALEPEYVHYFTREEIAAELHEGGFNLEHYSESPYGHAVGMAR